MNARAPFGSAALLPVRYDVTVLMPNFSLVLSSAVPFCDTEVASVYSGCAPSWYGHQTCGAAMVSSGKADGVKLTVLVVFAGTVTSWLTMTGASPGGVIVAVTVPAWDELVSLVMSVLTVSAELLRSAALSSTTRALPSVSVRSTSSWTGDATPVLLSGGIWFQSTSSRVNMVFGLFGLTSMASELVPGTARPVTLNVNLV